MSSPYYCRSDDPNRCISSFLIRRKGQLVRIGCYRRALWMVDGKQLCCDCFEAYLDSHPDVDPYAIERLSDVESDFERVNGEPICQVPKPKGVRRATATAGNI